MQIHQLAAFGPCHSPSHPEAALPAISCVEGCGMPEGMDSAACNMAAREDKMRGCVSLPHLAAMEVTKL